MSTMLPLSVGSDPTRDPPETLLDLTVQIEYPRDMPPSRMLDVADQVADRLEAALAPERFADLAVRVLADPGLLAPRQEPLYPLQMGAQTFTCHLDVVEAIERLCAGTDLASLAHDHAGRPHQVHVEVWFSRQEGAPS